MAAVVVGATCTFQEIKFIASLLCEPGSGAGVAKILKNRISHLIANAGSRGIYGLQRLISARELVQR